MTVEEQIKQIEEEITNLTLAIEKMDEERSNLYNRTYDIQLMMLKEEKESLTQIKDQQFDELEQEEDKRTRKILEISFKYGQYVRRRDDLVKQKEQLLNNEAKGKVYEIQPIRGNLSHNPFLSRVNE